MVHVSDVARYILEQQGPVTAMKLQKLVYYVQAWAVAKGDPIFSDAIKAWKQGPVVPSLWYEHKGRRSLTIEDMAVRGPNGPNAQQRAHMDSVLAHYGGLPPLYLSKLTHFERPWNEARALSDKDGIESPVISIESLRSFYSGRTPEDLEADFQMMVARGVMKKYEQTLARLAL